MRSIFAPPTEHPRIPGCSRRRAAALVTGLAATALLFSACGGSSTPSGGASPTAATTGIAGGAVAFAACMRAHGLAGYPDPKVSTAGDHVSVTITPGSLDPNSPAFKSAGRACIHLFPGVAPSRAVNRHEQAQALRFAACMRSHGVPSFPDPDHDGAFILPSGADQQAPLFERAKGACKNVEPSSLSIFNQPPPGS